MHRIFEAANNSNHKGRSYIIRVMKISTLIIQNIMHICSTQTATKLYLWDQIKKGTRQLEDIFMWPMPMEHDRIHRSFTADSRAHMAHDNPSNCNGGKKVMTLLPFIRIRKLDVGT